MGITPNLALLLLLATAALSTTPKCYNDKQLEASCATYCYNVVRPMLDISKSWHAKQSQIEQLQHELKISTDNYNAEHLKLLEAQMEVRELREKLAQQEVGRSVCEPAMQNKVPSSCVHYTKPGIHQIKLPDLPPFDVLCSAENGFGWTLIQRRRDGKEDFYRSWDEYRQGFGKLDGDFFIGLEKLHQLTKHVPHELYIFMKDAKLQLRSVRYDNFLIGDKNSNYKLLSLGNLTGYVGDVLHDNLNMEFTTKDKDNDKCGSLNCAQKHHGGWWYNCCSSNNFNGDYLATDDNTKIFWNPTSVELKYVYMLIRPRNIKFCVNV